MGWDAYAEGPRGGNLKPADLAAFKDASHAVVKVCGSVDCFLETGGLDCSACAYALEEATNGSAWDPNGWPVETVARHWEEADWDRELPLWAAGSARMFLKICAERGLSVQFSY